MTLNKSLNIALPKGRILDSVLPILLKVGIVQILPKFGFIMLGGSSF